MHTIKSPIKRHLELMELLPPDTSEIADAAFRAGQARNYLRAIIFAVLGKRVLCRPVTH